MKKPGSRIVWPAVFLLALAFGALAQTPVEEHWSPYDYPREIPTGVKHHIIVKGDTLWDIAGAYFGDPFLWPQLYQVNDYIRDPDLIYPGDPIILEIGVVVNDQTIAESLGDETSEDAAAGEEGVFQDFQDMENADEGAETQGDVGEEPETQITERSESSGFDDFGSEFVILPAGDRSDMECSSYIYPSSSARAELPFELTIAGSETPELSIYAEGHVVYLDKGAEDGLTPGAVYSVRRVMENVYLKKGRNGQRREFFGAAIDQVGQLKIVAVQANNATALITKSCRDIRVGDFCVPYEQEPIPLITEIPVVDRFQPFDKSGSGLIAYAEEGLLSFGKGHLANITLGLNQNVAPGDIFIIYRDNPNTNEKKGLILPDIYLGHAVALRTSEKSTLVKVIDAYTQLRVGDKIVPLGNGAF